MNESPEWYQFQEDICSYFRTLGVSAETNVTIQGIRTSHDIDILVKTKFLGQDIVWVIEAKKWKSKVNKLQVLGLRTIIDDIGADKGFIISDKGFQSGAKESTLKTNVQLMTYTELKNLTKELIQSEIIQTYKDRLVLLENRYWSHSKKIRQKYGLRGEIWDYPVNFSGHSLLVTAHLAINSALKNEYPIDLQTHSVEKKGLLIAFSFQELTNWLNLNLNFIDQKILMAEIEMIKNGDFAPDLFAREEIELPINMIGKQISTKKS
ncbi:restriction endonuclease [Flavobacterium bizetiae]|uniref:restriction endonuclease n=1 Tax=Flavobacterium bizetiae TaxID=2704140 RepID=UPI003757C4F7